MSTDVDLNTLSPGEYVRFEVEGTRQMAVMVKLNTKAHGNPETEADNAFAVAAPRFTALPVVVPRQLRTEETISISGQPLRITSHIYINS